MKNLRIPIVGLMGTVVLIAVGLAAFRSGSERWFESLYSLTIAVLLLGSVGAKYGREESRPFWFGFALFGWAYLLFGLGLRPDQPSVEDEAEMVRGLVNRFLITTSGIKHAYNYSLDPSDLERVGKYGYSLPIGHLILTLSLAILGGLIALVWSRPTDTTVESPPRRSARALWVLMGLALLLGCSYLLSARSRVSYFPDLAFDGVKEHDDFVRDWYSKHLEAMGEPSLVKLAQADRDCEVYRLLWLPTFDHPVAVRVEKLRDSISLNVVILDGQGGYEPGIIAVNKATKLGRPQWDELTRHLKRSVFWTLPTKSKEDEGGTDGEQMIVEGIAAGKYHIVDRWSPNGNEYAKLCRSMLAMAGIKLDGTDSTQSK
jgi:hypothetical protein